MGHTGTLSRPPVGGNRDPAARLGAASAGAREAAPVDTALLAPAVESLSFLLGTWTGEGRGADPTIDDWRRGEILQTRVDMAAVAHPLGFHGESELRRAT